MLPLPQCRDSKLGRACLSQLSAFTACAECLNEALSLRAAGKAAHGRDLGAGSRCMVPTRVPWVVACVLPYWGTRYPQPGRPQHRLPGRARPRIALLSGFSAFTSSQTGGHCPGQLFPGTEKGLSCPHPHPPRTLAADPSPPKTNVSPPAHLRVEAAEAQVQVVTLANRNPRPASDRGFPANRISRGFECGVTGQVSKLVVTCLSRGLPSSASGRKGAFPCPT